MKPVAYIVALLMIAYTAVAVPVVVLPDRFQGAHVINANSPEFNALIAKNKKLAAQLAKDNENWKYYSQDVEQRLREESDRAAKAEAELAKFKAQQSKSHWGIFSTLFGAFGLAVSFFGNPFGFIVGFAIKLLAGIVAAFFLLKFAGSLWRRFRKPKTP
jgi:hypothetical protein